MMPPVVAAATRRAHFPAVFNLKSAVQMAIRRYLDHGLTDWNGLHGLNEKWLARFLFTQQVK